MPGKFIYDLCYAVFSGFTAFFGVDASAHQRLLELLFGGGQVDPWMILALRIGALAALLFTCGPRLRRILRERRLSLQTRRLKRQPDPMAQLDLKLVRTAMLPVLAGVLLYSRGNSWVSGFLPLALVFLLNAAVQFAPRLLNSGNKDGRSVSPLDAILLGGSSILGALPGFSRMGCMLTVGAARGLDRIYALEMALVLSVPALIGLLVLDVIAVMAAQVALSFVALVLYIFYAVLAFLGGWASIVLMRFLAQKIGFTGFAYYSLGLALFSFIFYLAI